MKLLLRLLPLFLACLAALPAKADEESVRKAFQARFPKVKVESITRTSYFGLYEIVISGGGIVYTDDRFEHLVQGNIFETKSMTNLTEERLNKLAEIPWDSLPLELAFKRVKGKGERRMAVFTDPDCPACRRIEKDLAKLDNVTLYMFLLPIESLHPNAPARARDIWCSAERNKAWEAYMLNGTAPAAAKAGCETPVERIVKYADEHKISGTPTLFFPNGERIPGAIGLAEIEAHLAKSR